MPAFPLTEHLWLTAATACRVTACDTTAMIRMGDPWAGLDDFHRAVLDFIAEIEEHENVARWSEFQRSIAHEAALVESVSSRLAAAANKTADSAVDPGGRRSADGLPRGGTIHGHRGPPSPRRSAMNPVTPRATRWETWRAPAGFRCGPVTLADGWWRRRGGDPLLGRIVRRRAMSPWRSCRARPRAVGSGRPTSCMIPKGAAGPSTSSSPGASLRRPGCFTGRSPTNRSAKSDLIRFSLSLPRPGSRAGDGACRWPSLARSSACRFPSPPASSSTRSCRQPI